MRFSPRQMLLVLLIATTGCAFNHHGEFCGPGYPIDANRSDMTPEARLAALDHRSAIDDIDAACKRHDICYILKGNSNKECDNDLSVSMKKLELNQLCRNVADDISGWFILFHPSRGTKPGETVGIRSGKIVSLPLSLIGAALHGFTQMAGRVERDEQCCSLSVIDRTADDKCQPVGETDRILRIRRAIAANKPRREDVFVMPSIPRRVLRRVSAATQLPAQQRVIGLIRENLFSGVAAAVVFTEEGIFYKSAWRQPRSNFISYPEILEAPPEVLNNEVVVGAHRLELVLVKPDELKQLLLSVSMASSQIK
jgi:hypothetical protein